MPSNKACTPKQIKQHEEAANYLGLIKNEFAAFLKTHNGLNETACLTFIKQSYKKHGLVNDNKKEFAIVAFGKNTNQVHYFPKGKGSTLKPNTLILLDIWARLNEKGAPYADATFMFYKGTKVPKTIQDTWNVLMAARSRAIKVASKIPLSRGLNIDRAAHDVIGESGLGEGIKHTIGHSLGFDSPHGKLPGINWREYTPIQKNVGYTIEPGIYLKNFGLRTEIDFYINNQNKLIITTPLQEDIELI